MTHAEIYRAIQQLLPQELLDKYGHPCYGEMAEVPELAPWGGSAVGRGRVDES